MATRFARLRGSPRRASQSCASTRLARAADGGIFTRPSSTGSRTNTYTPMVRSYLTRVKELPKAQRFPPFPGGRTIPFTLACRTDFHLIPRQVKSYTSGLLHSGHIASKTGLQGVHHGRA